MILKLSIRKPADSDKHQTGNDSDGQPITMSAVSITGTSITSASRFRPVERLICLAGTPAT